MHQRLPCWCKHRKKSWRRRLKLVFGQLKNCFYDFACIISVGPTIVVPIAMELEKFLQPAMRVDACRFERLSWLQIAHDKHPVICGSFAVGGRQFACLLEAAAHGNLLHLWLVLEIVKLTTASCMAKCASSEKYYRAKAKFWIDRFLRFRESSKLRETSEKSFSSELIGSRWPISCFHSYTIQLNFNHFLFTLQGQRTDGGDHRRWRDGVESAAERRVGAARLQDIWTEIEA